VVSTTNNSVLGLSPAMTMTETYLGMGLASQLGFFSNANQYQNQSMVAIAAVVGAIKHPRTSKHNPNQPPLQAPTPHEPCTNNQDLEHAMKQAEENMGKQDS
jgi:hypothetical protein